MVMECRGGFRLCQDERSGLHRCGRRPRETGQHSRCNWFHYQSGGRRDRWTDASEIQLDLNRNHETEGSAKLDRPLRY